ncbi:MAG: dephospho-CoA kinase [Deltaproteobacteria bacterium]
MRVFGLTGGIGAGKSTVARCFREEGIPVVDADRISREILEPDREVFREVVRRFGTEILSPNGRIDRRRLGELVFRDPAARADLEALTHPAIREGIVEALRRLEREGHDVVIVEAALIHEKGRGGLFEAVIGVRCDPAVQEERILARDGFSREEARARIRAQMDPERKITASEYRIDNSGDLEDTRRQVQVLVRRLRGEG